MKIEIIPVGGIPLVKTGDDIAQIILDSISDLPVEEGDVFVIASTIVSKSEGQLHDLRSMAPSDEAMLLSERTGKDPRLCELIIKSSRRILRVGEGPIISETLHGFICASSGIDTSNIAGDAQIVATLPVDPDASARRIRESLQSSLDRRIAVIISDTHGRPFRSGAIGVCVGLSGIEPLYCYKGEKDLYGYELKASVIARADEIASAADLAMGQSNEGYPVIIVRGSRYIRSEQARATDYIREEGKDLFR